MTFDAIRALPLFSNTPLDFAIALGVAAGLMIALLFVRRLVRRWHARMLKTDKVELLEVPLEILSRTTVLFFFVLCTFVALRMLKAGPATERVLTAIITVTLFWQGGLWLAAAVGAWLERKRKRHATDDRAAVSSLGVIGFISQLLIWSIMGLLALDNLGVNITALVTGLGIGGVAIALALQNILGDLFASLSITLDRPFVIGDFLILDDFMGSVEYIGVKTTRLRSLGGEQLVMSNSDITKSRVRNYGRMNERRVVFSFGVTYQTPADTVEGIPPLVKKVIQSQKDVRFDRCHFAKYGASSLDFEIVYYVLSPDYNRYMDIQQAINLTLYREFEERKIDFAYPTQMLYMTRAPREPQQPQRRAS